MRLSSQVIQDHGFCLKGYKSMVADLQCRLNRETENGVSEMDWLSQTQVNKLAAKITWGIFRPTNDATPDRVSVFWQASSAGLKRTRPVQPWINHRG